MIGERVVVGMSGGVDSSVAAALLLKQGYDVVGITLKMWPQDCGSIAQDKCCGPQAMSDARHVASRLGIPHYILDETADFEKSVIQYFTQEYQAGRTPNPCVLCNEKLKFGTLMTKSHGLGASRMATGHYAQIEKQGKGFVLKRAKDLHKDQSYFLFSLCQEQLSKILTPLGHLTKAEVRVLAKEIGLKIHDKIESQDICFIEKNDYISFLKKRLGSEGFHSGHFVSSEGKVLGTHAGYEGFTVGQRKGINVGSPKPLYVKSIDPIQRHVVVGDDHELWENQLVANSCTWGQHGIVKDGTPAFIKIRSHHEGAEGTLHPRSDGTVLVCFQQPQRAITPGQAAVFYQEDVVIGGGWIM